MMGSYDHIWAKSEMRGAVSLAMHLRQTAICAVYIAGWMGLDPRIARLGALLHDIGKASILFQNFLRQNATYPFPFRFRHEIASLFFLSLVEKAERPFVLEMVIAHHKSLSGDKRNLGLLDMEDWEDNNFELHARGFEQWSEDALGILQELGLVVHKIGLEEARRNYEEAVAYCRKRKLGCSEWKGLMLAADWLGLAYGEDVEAVLPRLFVIPDLSCYDNPDPLYPLSLRDARDGRRHTMVVASTGSGKTSFLFRRCRGRVFYILPFQASINAMYERVRQDLQGTDAFVTLLHAVSCIKWAGQEPEERILQRMTGASVKVMTPHQIASVVFGGKGYEAMVIDLKGCDVILDEIHTYSDVMQAIVLKLVEVLVHLGCRVHIGTATMPSVLYQKIIQLLGGEKEVYEVRLSPEELDSFDRHVIYKVKSFEETEEAINEAIAKGRKVLIVCNQVKRAQALYGRIAEKYAGVSKMLIHGRFKRGCRALLEAKLLKEMNVGKEACIVVSTQVVEVSLDINFDLMVTECAALDALLQRLGRINRLRVEPACRTYKPIYVIQPLIGKKDVFPYDADILKKSYAVLPDGKLLKERQIQELLDEVYPPNGCHFVDIEMNVAFREGAWKIFELDHYSKSVLLERLEIDSVACICESDCMVYEQGNSEKRLELEIPVSFRSIRSKGLRQLAVGIHPFVIPDRAYSEELGLLSDRMGSGYRK